MNRRQKIKNLKKELARCKNQPSKKPVDLYPSTPYEIRTIAVDRMIEKEEEEFLGANGVRYLLAKDLLDEICKLIQFEKYHTGFVEMPDRFHYQAELKVAVPRT